MSKTKTKTKTKTKKKKKKKKKKNEKNENDDNNDSKKLNFDLAAVILCLLQLCRIFLSDCSFAVNSGNLSDQGVVSRMMQALAKHSDDVHSRFGGVQQF